MNHNNKIIKWFGINVIFLLLFLGYKLIIEQVSYKYSHIDFIAHYAILSIILLIMTIRMTIDIENDLSMYALICFLSHIFFFGQHYLVALNMYNDEISILSGKISTFSVLKTSTLIVYCLIVMNIGYIIAFLSKNNKIYKNSSNYNFNVEKENLYKICKVVFFIVLIPTLITIGTNIYYTVRYGYTGQHSASGIANVLSGYMVPALLGMYITKEQRKFPLIAITTYLILYLISGSRSSAICLLSCIIFHNIRFSNNKNYKSYIKYVFISIPLIFFLSILSSVRGNFNDNTPFVEVIINGIMESKSNNILNKILAETGFTFIANGIVVDNCPSTVPHINGKSFLAALAYIVPNFVTNDFYNTLGTVDSNFSRFNYPYQSGIGSSFIAEAYWNFGYGAIIITFLYGIILGLMIKRTNSYIISKNYLGYFLMMYSFSLIVFYVRSDTSTFLRRMLWFGLPIFYFTKILSNSSIRRNINESINSNGSL